MSNAKFEWFRDRAGLWRWHLKVPNGLIIADSGQGYRELSDCIAGAYLVKQYAPNASVGPAK